MIWLIAVGGLLGLVYGALFCWRDASWLRSAIKTGAVALPALALSGMGLPVLALAGLWACVLGDYLLSRPSEPMLKGGIAAFALGHVLYVAAFLTVFPVGAPDGVFWLVAVVLAGLGLSTERWLAPHTGALRWVVRGYVVLILSMGVSAALPGVPREWVLAGALCFIASDLILSTLIFLGHAGRGRAYAVWALYYVAQGLIMAGFWTYPGV